MIRRSASIVLVVVLFSCGASNSQRRTKPSRSTPAMGSAPAKPVGLRFPRILPAMPEGEMLDLGPVLVPKDYKAKESPQAVLLAAADRLGADAFVYESRAVSDVYRIRRERVRVWRDSYTGDYFETTVHVYEGPMHLGPGGPPPTTDTGYYRAIRHLKRVPTPCPIDRGIVDEKTARLLEVDLPFKDQIRILNVLFAQGLIKRSAFQAQRLRCLEHLDREEAVPAPAEP